MPTQELRPVTILSSDEPWTIIKLADGSEVRVRLNITSAHAVFIDGKPALDGGGDPLYAIKWVCATHVVEAKSEGKPN